MHECIKKNLFPFVVFVTGACVLIIEIVAVRALSPYYGNTIFTVSSVISVVLAALSVGYHIGGNLADRLPSPQRFFGIILASGVLVLAVHFLSVLTLPILGIALSPVNGPLVASLLLFFLPALLLGILSPYAIKLHSAYAPAQGIGSVSGSIFFWSTLGSISGSLLTGFVLIPKLGVDLIFISTGITLCTLGLIPLIVFSDNKNLLAKTALVVIVLVGAAMFINSQAYSAALYHKDGIYEKITIYDSQQQGRPVRVLQQDRSSSGAMFLDTNDPTDLAYEYTKYYALYKLFQPDVRSALVIGGGAYSIPKALLAELPNVIVDVAEIEPSLYPLAQQYFSVKGTPRLHNHITDGRHLLRDTNQTYDVIFSDVYSSLFSIPAHFTTREFFSLAKEKLAPNGVFIANIIGDLSRQQPSLLFSEIKTFQQVFPNSYFFAVETPKNTHTQNIIFVGYNSIRIVDMESVEVTRSAHPLIRSLPSQTINLERYELSPYPILTDNYAPVEYLTAEVLARQLSKHDSINGNEMLAIIDQQIRYGPRYMGSRGHKSVQKALLAEMRTYTDEVIAQSWEYPATDGNTYTLTNIVGRLFPEQNRRIIIATHYDSKRFADKDKTRFDQPVPGANDSASGVAVLLELARVVSNASVTPKIGVDLVFFDGEEGDINQRGDYSNWRPLGSTYFAEHIHEVYGDTKPMGAIVLDMVCGKNIRIQKEPFSLRYAEDLVESFWAVAQKVDGSVFQNNIGPSVQDDHIPLNQADIPSILLIDAGFPAHHTTNDTLDRCSDKSLEVVARATLEYLYSLQ
ncbi:MAG: hypothetical protein KatS3mg100_281 [Candidatus Parcubacteria bacterium]|nr:MAG: hypothetical protein KatS3mg100_281 [Candidatus Parcubacteria bacterium]